MTIAGKNFVVRNQDQSRNIIGVLCYAWTLLHLILPAFAHAQGPPQQHCAVELTNCFVSDDSVTADSSTEAGKYSPALAMSSRVVTMELRASHGGPFAHQWLEVEGSQGRVTLGFGPAILPFIDFGEISVRDDRGNAKRIAGLHLFSINYGYAKGPWSGRLIGAPIQLTIAQADALIEKVRHRHFFIPYIPLFHDCRTFACATQATARGKSTLPCYFLFKGYW